MGNDFLKRLVSGVILAAIMLFSILKGGIFLKGLLLVTALLMLKEWLNITRDKRFLFFISGLCYILIPMLFWFMYPSSVEILWIFFIVWSCDIFAYLGGKIIGGRKFAPSISPGKTWSGVICGFLASFMTSYFYIQNFLGGDLILIYISPLLISASILGDLLESKIKRILKVKDTGNLIPGHGGVCDRLDSFLLASYVFVILKLF